MSFGDQTTTGIHNIFSPVGIVTFFDKFSCFALNRDEKCEKPIDIDRMSFFTFSTKSQSFISDQFISRKTILKITKDFDKKILLSFSTNEIKRTFLVEVRFRMLSNEENKEQMFYRVVRQLEHPLV